MTSATLLGRRAPVLAATAGLLCLGSAVSPAHAQGDFAIKDGDHIVFYGDSITDGRGYTTPVEAYIVTRFPKMKVDFTHSGWSGDRVTGGGGGNIDTRLPRDVFAYKPTVVTVMLGMNDGGYRADDETIFSTYTKGYQHIVDATKAALPGVRMTLIQPSPYDDVTRAPNFPGGYNGVLQKYGAFVKDLAAKQGQSSADLNGPVVEMLSKANAAKPDMAQLLIKDRVHPGAQASLIMSEALLKSWNAPALVSATEIDGAAGKVSRADNTKISDLVKGDKISWTQLDGALPLPLSFDDSFTALVLNSSDFVQALDQQTLKITGLAPGTYSLNIDGKTLKAFSADQLGTGINLATMPTPMWNQAMQVWSLTNQHLQTHQAAWRNIQVPLTSDPNPAVQAAVKVHMPPILDAYNIAEQEMVAKQRAAAQPVPHKFELVKAG